ncbi:hypothetical protein R1CP_34085 [Rhodococcus opacus]|uniref:DUF3349 domain-containing protein n=1 Tax=Rhodococcus opacus TaxID=37919 RepID=A0A1B1KFN9_RHOOP|nr:hypothetical protein R1CP_34085 [Rhodococcus opacus]
MHRTSITAVPAKVLAWVRGGYPHGIPREDYVALFAVLHRHLTETEVGEIVDELSAPAGHALEDGRIDRAEIEDAIAHLVHEHPDDDDITRVASRLAAGGWPLESALAEKTPPVKALPPLLASIIGWLRAGYPQGVPENDYLPLIALLRRRLSDEEVREITAALVDQGDLPIGKPDIQMMITKVTNEIPLDVDVERVRAHLVAGGWAITDDTPNDHPH